MKNIHRFALYVGSLLFSLFTVNALAENHYIIELSKDSTVENPQAFYCTATGVNTKVFMNNVAQMVKGFGDNGILFITPGKLNSVYFLAYHDPDLKYAQVDGWVTSAIPGKGTIKCELGTGNRNLIEGDFK